MEQKLKIKREREREREMGLCCVKQIYIFSKIVLILYFHAVHTLFLVQGMCVRVFGKFGTLKPVDVFLTQGVCRYLLLVKTLKHYKQYWKYPWTTASNPTNVYSHKKSPLFSVWGIPLQSLKDPCFCEVIQEYFY